MRMLTAALAVLLVAGALAVGLGCGGGTRSSDFEGDWLEEGRAPEYVMSIEATSADTLRVDYGRFYQSPREFQFDDGRLTYSSGKSQAPDVITRDRTHNAITITSGSTGQSVTLIPATP